jgi:hypothetical protein
MSYTVRDFAFQSYRLINAHNPTVPLHGDDQLLLIQVLNQLMQYYASTGLMLTIAKTVNVDINLGNFYVNFTNRDYPDTVIQTETVLLDSGSPTFSVENGGLYNNGDSVTGTGIPANTIINNINGDVITLNNNATITGLSVLTFTHSNLDPQIAYIKEGRLANLDSAWLQLNGVTYPLIMKNRDDFLAAWKYEPLQGLPRFIITYPETDLVSAQLYPAPSQFYTFFCRGKFQLNTLSSNDNLSVLPQYYIRFLLFAVARDVAMYKGRSEAWTEKLEALYMESKDVMEAASEVNLSIAGDEQSLLNGNWRVMAGI